MILFTCSPKHTHIYILPLIISVTFLCCGGKIRRCNALTVSGKIPEGRFQEELLSHIKIDKKGNDSLRLVIYRYTTGKEIISYSKDRGFSRKMSPGMIRAMVKIYHKDKLEEVLEITVKGKSRKELIKNLGREISRAVGG